MPAISPPADKRPTDANSEKKKSLLKFPPLVKAVEEKSEDKKLVFDGNKF